MSLPRYPTYKDSGVEWLGEVPGHWVVRKLLDLARIESGHTPSRQHDEYWIESECVIPWFTLADVSYLRDLRNVYVRTTSQRISAVGMENSAARLLPPGTVLLSRTASVGFSGITEIELAVSQDFAAWICGPHLQATFLLSCLRAMKGEFSRLMMGSTHQTIYMPDIMAFRVPLPPLDEQSHIAAFLDRETAKIDALVAEQERLIDLLKEKRQAVISHAVTKGLNPDAPMKDSGVEWLGEVPAHWAFGALKYFVVPKNGAIKTGPFGSHLVAADMQNGTIKVYNQRSVIDCDFEFGENFISESKFAELTAFEAFPGDLLITTRGTIGRAAILPDNAERGILHPCLLRVQPDASKVDTRFLQTLIQDSDVMRTQISLLSNATTIEVIYSYTIAAVLIPVPPLAEQRAILSFLGEQTSRIDLLTTEAQRAIDLLQERRTALISAAVTGQIDVRPPAERASA